MQKEIATDLKRIYTAATAELAEQRLRTRRSEGAAHLPTYHVQLSQFGIRKAAEPTLLLGGESRSLATRLTYDTRAADHAE